MTPVEEAVSQVGRWREVAAHLVEAMAGWGTEEDEIFNALEGRSPSEIEAIRSAYLDLTGHPLEVDLRDEMSGSELRRALNLLNTRAAGEFTNEREQNMTEGGTTVVKGRFNWTLREDALEVDVPVKFRPDEGVPLPLGLWNGQIDTTWNQFAVTEPGGRNIEIRMALRDDQGDERTIRVIQNTVPGSYGHPDRANAGKWYPVMPANTAPHEFGHLIGLEDEYQRTHGDFKRITGEDRTGPANASGKTEAAIATELQTALHGDDVTTRAAAATTVLVNCGLIAGGRPQQGDFAQAVMAAYDDAHGNLFSDLQGLPSGTNWTLMTVFSYASGTVMGNASVVGVQPHEHPVMDRHLREFAAIVRRGYPSFEWTIGPK
jgi:hypothetical protein